MLYSYIIRTQPKPIFAEPEEDESDQQEKKKFKPS